MSQGFAQAGKCSLLNKNGLIPQLQIFTGLVITMPGCFLRVGTFLDLRFNPFERRLQSVLTLLQGRVTGRRSLSKCSHEVDSGEVLPSLMFQILSS